jgi:hypothetical protein
VLWFAARRSRRVPQVIRGRDGRRYRYHGLRRTVAKTVFGEVAVRRAFYVVGDGKRGDTWVPFDQEVGLQPTRFSLLAIGFAAYLSAKMAFARLAARSSASQIDPELPLGAENPDKIIP